MLALIAAHARVFARPAPLNRRPKPGQEVLSEHFLFLCPNRHPKSKDVGKEVGMGDDYAEKKSTGMLYLVPTPIGNRRDMTLRALDVLRTADVIACEDTRHSSPLLESYAIHRPLLSYHQHNEQERSEELLFRVEQGERVAVISDAGMPGVSDPGGVLVRKAISRGLPYTVLPGASAVPVAAVASGIGDGRFAFFGFLPRKGKEREEVLSLLDSFPLAAICYESPYRIRQTLAELGQRWPERSFAVLREWSKQYEEVLHFTGYAGKDLALTEKGEFAFVIGPAAAPSAWTDEEVIRTLREKQEQGISAKQAMKEIVAASGRSRNEVYQLREEDRSAEK